MGDVANLHRAQEGRVEPDGSVYDRSGILLGRICADSVIRSIHCQPLGWIGADGAIFDQNNVQIGSVRVVGGAYQVFNLDNICVGYISATLSDQRADMRLACGAARLTVLARA